jgi:hypothetical protein
VYWYCIVRLNHTTNGYKSMLIRSWRKLSTMYLVWLSLEKYNRWIGWHYLLKAYLFLWKGGYCGNECMAIDTISSGNSRTSHSKSELCNWLAPHHKKARPFQRGFICHITRCDSNWLHKERRILWQLPYVHCHNILLFIGTNKPLTNNATLFTCYTFQCLSNVSHNLPVVYIDSTSVVD